MMTAVLAAACSWVVTVLSVGAPGVVSAGGPSAIGVRNAHAMVFDEARGRVTLYGGADAAAVRGETWEWDGSRWSLAANEGPGPRTFPAMAYDSRRGRIVLFGGNRVLFGRSAEDNIFLGDTWEWDGKSWTRIDVPGPPVRSEAAMAFDTRRGRIVLFGGHSGTGETRRRFGDTWEWDGRRWVEAKVTGPSPSPRNGAAAAFDSARGRVVLFGGSTQDGVSGETWEWDGKVWRENRGAATEGRFNPVMAYATAWRKVVRFGGRFGGRAFGDTWEYDGRAWKAAGVAGAAGAADRRGATGSNAPSPRNHAAMTYDAKRRRIVLFGGHLLGAGDGAADVFGDTWEWDGSAWTEAAPGEVLERVDNGH
jgi:hypothetical protein